MDPNIITIYRIGSGFRNVPDTLVLERPGSEYIYWEDQYILPDGYQVSETIYGEPAIYDPKGDHCNLALSYGKKGAVLCTSVCGSIALRKAPDGAKPIPLREARINTGLTQQQLADATGINVRQIQRVELGEAEAGNLTAKNLLAIAEVLGIDPNTLV